MIKPTKNDLIVLPDITKRQQLHSSDFQLNSFPDEGEHFNKERTRLLSDRDGLADLVTYATEKGRKLHSELVAAQNIAKQIKNIVRVDEHQFPYFFTGTEWKEVTDNDFSRLINDVIGIATIDSGGVNAKFIKSIAKLVQDQAPLQMKPEMENHIPFLNGLLCVETSVLKQTTPDNALRYCLPHPHVEGENHPRIDDFLNNLFDGDVETINVLLAHMALTIRGMGLDKFQIMLLLTGPSGAGKGVIIRLYESMIGIRNILNLEINPKQTTLSLAYGMRLLIYNEIPKILPDLEIFKRIHGGDLLSADRKWKSALTFRVTAASIGSSNFGLPSDDQALKRRAIAVPTLLGKTNRKLRKFGSEMESQLAEELPALINSLLKIPESEIVKRLEELSPAINDANGRLLSSDPVADWIEDNLMPCDKAESDCYLRTGSLIREEHPLDTSSTRKIVPTSIVYKNSHIWAYPNYRNWCDAAGVHLKNQVDDKMFKRRIRQIAEVNSVLIEEKLKGSNGSVEGRGKAIVGIKFKPDEIEATFSELAKNGVDDY